MKCCLPAGVGQETQQCRSLERESSWRRGAPGWTSQEGLKEHCLECVPPSAQSEIMCAHHWGMVPEQVPEDGTPGCAATLEMHWTVMLRMCSRLVILGMCTMNPVETTTKCNSCTVPGEYIALGLCRVRS